MTFLSHSIQRIKPSPTLAVAAQATTLKAQGKDVIDLSVGEPDFDTPEFIKEAAREAIQKGQTKYTAVDGTPALKQAIVQKFVRENGLTFSSRQISVGCGGKQVIFNALMTTLNPGDEVVIPAPYWVSYPDMTCFAGGIPVLLPCPQAQGFKLLPQDLEKAITPRTKWLIFNSPSNPTGATYTPDEIKALMTVLECHPHVWILSDDIYEHLLYDNQSFSTLGVLAPFLRDRLLTVNGVSKAYAMTGWRIGYGAGPESLIKAMATLQSQSTSNPCSIAQAAAAAALQGDAESLLQQARVFEERRNGLFTLIQKLPGLSCPQVPGGAFYLYPSCAGLIGAVTPQGKKLETDQDVATYFLEAAEVSVVPGSAFGLSPHLRLSYATSLPRLEEACMRLEKAILALSDLI